MSLTTLPDGLQGDFSKLCLTVKQKFRSIKRRIMIDHWRSGANTKAFAYFLSDAFLELDRIFEKKLPRPDVMRGQTAMDRAAEEGVRMKRLLGALRYLWRSSPSEAHPSCRKSWCFLDPATPSSPSVGVGRHRRLWCLYESGGQRGAVPLDAARCGWQWLLRLRRTAVWLQDSATLVEPCGCRRDSSTPSKVMKANTKSTWTTPCGYFKVICKRTSNSEFDLEDGSLGFRIEKERVGEQPILMIHEHPWTIRRSSVIDGIIKLIGYSASSCPHEQSIYAARSRKQSNLDKNWLVLKRWLIIPGWPKNVIVSNRKLLRKLQTLGQKKNKQKNTTQLWMTTVSWDYFAIFIYIHQYLLFIIDTGLLIS